MIKIQEVLDENVIQEHIKQGHNLITCPCCNNETFDDYFICPHCGWEYDGTVEVDVYSSTNKSTIKSYVNNLML